MKIQHTLLFAIIAVTASACGGNPSAPSEESTCPQCPSPQPPVVITTTPMPTATPVPLPPPEEVMIALRNYRLISQDTAPESGNYDVNNAKDEADGLTIYSQGYLTSRFTLKPYEALLLHFKLGSDYSTEGVDNTKWDFYINLRTAADLGSEDFYNFGFNKNSTITAQAGEYLPGEAFDGSLVLTWDTWYYALLTVDPYANFLLYIWDDMNRFSQVSTLYYSEDWQDREWLFNIWSDVGTVTVDRVDLYAFGEINVTSNTHTDWSGDWTMSGIGGISTIRLTQEGNEVNGEVIEWAPANKFLLEGTTFDYDDPRGGYYSVLRGMYYLENFNHPGLFNTIWFDWQMRDDGIHICGRGHGGNSIQWLVKVGAGDFLDDESCYSWYYYDK